MIKIVQKVTNFKYYNRFVSSNIMKTRLLVYHHRYNSPYAI